jgi:quercetin dioxygenase-like cupin family protein
MPRGLWCGVFALAAATVSSASAQDPLTLPGKNYTVAFENSDVAVIRAHYGPHEKIPVHDHTSYSTVFVYLSDSGPVRINHEEAGSAEAPVTRPPTVKGAYRVAPGIAERHSIANLGDLSSDFLRVELKQVSLKMKERFRGKAPVSLGADTDVVEFDDPQVRIERIVCVGAEACAVKAEGAPSLVVAFTSFAMTLEKTKQNDTVKAGAVRWVPAGEGISLKAEGDGVAHLLRMSLPQKAR